MTAIPESTARLGLPGEDLTGDPFLARLCDLYDAARAASDAASAGLSNQNKQKRLAAMEALRAAAQAADAAEAAIDAYMHAHRQPVRFDHNGWRWSIPSQPRGLICVAIDRQDTRGERK